MPQALAGVGPSCIQPRPVTFGFHVLVPFKEVLKGLKLDEDIKAAVMKWFQQQQPREFCMEYIYQLVCACPSGTVVVAATPSLSSS